MSLVKSIFLSVEMRTGQCGMGLGVATPCAFSGDSSVLRVQQRIHRKKNVHEIRESRGTPRDAQDNCGAV